jgi:two-component system response regulator VanR
VVRAKTVQKAISVMNNLELYIGIIINGDNISYVPGISIIRNIAPNMPIHVVMDGFSLADKEIAVQNGVTWIHNWEQCPADDVRNLLCAIQEKNYESYNKDRDYLPIFLHKDVLLIAENYNWVFRNDRKIPITGKDFSVLFYILSERPRIATSEQILQDIWQDRNYDEYAVRKCVSNINNKLEIKFIENVRGQGYRIIL